MDRSGSCRRMPQWPDRRSGLSISFQAMYLPGISGQVVGVEKHKNPLPRNLWRLWLTYTCGGGILADPRITGQTRKAVRPASRRGNFKGDILAIEAAICLPSNEFGVHGFPDTNKICGAICRTGRVSGKDRICRAG